VLGPALPAFLSRFPDIAVEIAADDQLRDIVSDGFDAGVRLGERVDKDMVSVRISGEIPTAVVGAPAYFKRNPAPVSPHDLIAHDCIGHRMGTGALHPWPFEECGRPFLVKVKGRLTFNDSDLILDAALAGGGLAYVFADQVDDHRRAGRLVGVLDRWTATHAGYFLYYASRRQQPPALAALIEWLRNATLAVRA
jgi:DNA-binding transcriptional LysR family regulator